MYIITDDQKKRLRALLENADEILAQDELDDFLILLDDEIVCALGDKYTTTDQSTALQDIYDEVYDQNTELE